MHSCPRFSCPEEFDTRMELGIHEQVHWLHKCDICEKPVKNKHGLSIHHSKIHGKDNINLKYDSIREMLESSAQFQNMFKYYHQNLAARVSIDNTLNLVNFFRVRHTKISFKTF